MTADLFQVLLSPWALGLLGLAIGSFLNVVAYRLPVMMERQWWSDVAMQLGDADSWQRTFGGGAPTAPDAPTAPTASTLSADLRARLESLEPLTLSRPGSRCPYCNTPIAWRHNIPVFGWIGLRGRCAQCRAPISPRYPIVEAVTGVVFAAIGWRFGAQPAALMWCGFAAVLVALSLIDWDTTLLPDGLTLPLLWAGLVAALPGWSGTSLRDAVLGAVAGYGSLWTVYWAFKLATGKEGMGQGDFKLLGALGAWLGWTMVLPIALAASVVGAVVGIGMKFGGALREGRYVPFGPFLAAGGLAVLLAGPQRVLGWMGWA